MEEIASFDISQDSRSALTPGTVGVVLSNDVTMLARFNRKEVIANQPFYYFTVVYSDNPEYKINREVHISGTQFKNFLPVSGPVKIIRLAGQMYMITSKQTYPL